MGNSDKLGSAESTAGHGS